MDTTEYIVSYIRKEYDIPTDVDITIVSMEGSTSNAWSEYTIEDFSFHITFKTSDGREHTSFLYEVDVIKFLQGLWAAR